MSHKSIQRLTTPTLHSYISSCWPVVSYGITCFAGHETVWCYVLATPEGFKRCIDPAFA
jgi:hypothetical protein